MIIKQDIYGFKEYQCIQIEYDSVTLDIKSSSVTYPISNHPYFTMVTDAPIGSLSENVWISDDNKLISLADVFPLFTSASYMIDVLRKKKTSDEIIDHINFLKL